MRIALISDIHGNLEALSAVMARIDETRPDEIWCLGDIVGYGADPSACIDLVRSRCSLVIAGNHDFAVTRDTIPAGYDTLPRTALIWTRARLAGGDIDWLRSLPVSAQRSGCVACHGALHQRYAYIDSDDEARLNLSLLQTQYPEASILLCGHTHIKSWAGSNTRWRSFSSGTSFDWPEESLVMINPGSVGQPRDRSPKASWALLDLAARSCEMKTASYEVGRAQAKIIAAGLPHWLAERLASGN